MASGGAGVVHIPTWAVAIVCSCIVVISLAFERSLHYLGKFLKRKNQKSLYEALLKIKEELMLLGFISLLLTAFQSMITDNICIPKDLANKWLPYNCKNEEESKDTKTTLHFESFISPHGIARHLLAEASNSENKCTRKNEVPLLSTKTLDNLHLFIFILAVAHVTFSALTILFGGAKIRQWKHWEELASQKEYYAEEVPQIKITDVRRNRFIKKRFLGIGKRYDLLSWLHSFFKQFYGYVNEIDYATLRRGFIRIHCKGNSKFNFHMYIMRALEADFKKVVGISWYLWLFFIVFLILNVYGWRAYFWIAFIPLIVSSKLDLGRDTLAFTCECGAICLKQLLLAVGTKLEHIITELAQEIAERHEAIEGDLIVKPSDDHFWFHRPRLILKLINFIVFQNSLEIAFFFWIWFQYKFDHCIMGEVKYMIPRLIIRVFVQFLCSYSTLPLYALVSHMGSSFNKDGIFNESVQEGLVHWAKEAKKNTALRKADKNNTNQVSNMVGSSSVTLELGKVDDHENKESAILDLLRFEPFLVCASVTCVEEEENGVKSKRLGWESHAAASCRNTNASGNSRSYMPRRHAAAQVKKSLSGTREEIFKSTREKFLKAVKVKKWRLSHI